MSSTMAQSSADEIVERALACHRGGQLADAESLYRKALSIAPAHPSALHYLGLLGFQTGHLVPAEQLLAEAARIAPGDPAVLNNWGIVLAKLGRIPEAKQRFESAVALGPGYADALVNLANVLLDLGDYNGAEARYREAIAIAADSAEAHNNLGKLLLIRRRLPEAVRSFEAALRVNPRHASALNNLGNALRDQGRLKEAFERYRAAQIARPDEPDAFSNLLLAMNCDPELSAAEVFAAHREFADRFERPLAGLTAQTPIARRPGRLRIGYVSADFRAHAVAAFIEPLLEHHDRERFEVSAYYNAFAEDEVTGRIRAAVDRFVVVAGLSDAELVRRIRDDAIDVLVDLSGHTAGNRLLAFARRAAPVQVTWLGYLNTTGLSAMDYRITDAWADPPGATERWHTETLVRLPGSVWCYRPWPDSPPVGAAPALQNRQITFGSANNPAKLNLAVLQSWAAILGRVSNSRMLVHAPDDGDLRAHITKVICRQGIADRRIEFFPRLPVAEYLDCYAKIDIALDTFPCAGGTTTFDALWMGVPVVSIAGERPFSRGGASILGNLGLTDCLASSTDEYIERAVTLAGDLDALAARRVRLRRMLEDNILTDGPAFTRSMEKVFMTLCKARDVVPTATP
jgi:predicted O-linked N-acetylglucosamine transferase (SPINDLY family)